MIRPIDIGWIAALLEGEGHFSQRKVGLPRIDLDMCDKDVIERASILFGVSHIGIRRPNGTSHLRPVYCLRVPAGPSAQWMMTVYSLMGKRRKRQIRDCLRRWREGKRTNGWLAHRQIYGCRCQQHTGSCQRLHPVERLR